MTWRRRIWVEAVKKTAETMRATVADYPGVPAGGALAPASAGGEAQAAGSGAAVVQLCSAAGWAGNVVDGGARGCCE